MHRRRFLGVSGVGALAVAGGCLGALEGTSDDAATEYPTETLQEKTVPLAPLADVYGWWEDGDAEFVDTRGRSQYDASHVPGAVLSPAADERADDPTDGWERDARIVTYCDCPHSLAVLRASELLADGFENVYALDDGYLAWEEAGHPTESNDPDAEITAYEISGSADPAHAGAVGHVSTAEGDNYESVRIADDGSYETTIRFPDLTAESVLVVEAGGYTREGTLTELVDGEVTDG